MSCLLCVNSTLRGEFKDDRSNDAAKSLAKAGFVRCKLEIATFKPFDATCDKFSPLEPERAAARLAWAKSSDS